MSELIDRQALIVDYRICGGCSGFENCSGHITMCDSARIRQAINEAPTIEAEPVRHGRWILDHHGVVVCNLCRYPQQIGAKDFCGKCGARMDGGANNG